MRVSRTASAVLAAMIGIAGLPGVAGAALENPVPSTDVLTISETGEVSPLTPGVASEVHATVGFQSPVYNGDGFALVTDDMTDFTVEEIALDGTVETSTIEVGGFEAFYIVDVVTDEFVLLRIVEFAGFETSSSLVMRFDRATGEFYTPFVGFLGRTDPAQMSADGATIATYAEDGPFVVTIAEGGGVEAIEWDDDPDFVPSDLQPQLSPAATRAAVIGEVDGGPGGAIWIRSTVGGDDQVVPVPCGSVFCNYDITAFTSLGAAGTIFFTVADVDFVNHYKMDVATGAISDAPQVSLTSDNGRFVVGPAPSSAEAATDIALSIHDLENDRVRTIEVAGISDPYALRPVALSNDGLTLHYTAQQVCPGLCVARDSYFGQFELEPVAEVTRGPAEDQILRLYRAVFGRIPDAEGFEFWMDQYRNGRSLVDIAAEFAVSDEFVDRYGANPTDEALVAGLYDNVLGREGESAGVSFWLDQLGDGVSVARVLVGFADSPENVDRTATRQPITVAEGQVLRLYRAVLGRAPDASGLAFWLGEYNTGMELTEMARLFTGQEEFRGLYGTAPTNVELVDAVYLNVLGRPGDSGGVDFWLGQLDDGLTVPELFVEFANSDENVESTGTVR